MFLANVEGPWIHPDAMDAEELDGDRRACPSGAIRYRRKDGGPEEHAPPVNLVRVREGGPYAIRGELSIDGKPIGYRATLCRCGASKNKPFCEARTTISTFGASGEPPTGEKTAMLAVRDGPLEIDPQTRRPAAWCAAIWRSSPARAAWSRACKRRVSAAAAMQQHQAVLRWHARRIGFRSD